MKNTDKQTFKAIESAALTDGWQAGVQGQILRAFSPDNLPHLDEQQLQFYNRKFAKGHERGSAHREGLRYDGFGHDEQEMDYER